MRFTLMLSVLFLAAASILQAEEAGKPQFSPAASSKFANLPGVPACVTLSVQRGDPSKGAAVILLKIKPGCVVPWHWHSAGGQLIMVSGSAKIEMKDGAPVNFHPGDFIYMPSKHAHQFTCNASCLLFELPEGAFDIHYVDAAGKEISSDEAIKTPAAKTKMKMSAPAAKTKEQ